MIKSGWIVGVLLVGVVAMGCSSPLTATSPSEAQSSDRATATPTPAQKTVSQDVAAQEMNAMRQSLPLSAQVKVGSQVIQLEVAKTPDQQSIGLMNRKEMAGDRGMLFPFTPARPVAFWMKNTLIPLDMVFLHKGKVVSISSNVPPCKADPCPSYGPPAQALVDQVIELTAGRAAELGIKAGDSLTVKPL
jgi:uncharacterized protein